MKLLQLRQTGELVLCVETVNDCLDVQVDNDWYLGNLFAGWYETQKLTEKSHELTVDFERCEFLAPSGVIFLAGILRHLRTCGVEIYYRWETLTDKVRMNLAQNGFLRSFGCEDLSWDGNSIPYRCDLQHDEAQVAEYLRDKWLGKGWVNVSTALRNKIVGQVAEIYLNAFEHSQTKLGVFSCGQHYPSLGILQLAVVDFGLGIPTTVRAVPENASMSSEDALNWAFQPHTTTRRDNVPGGMGLNLLKEFVTLNHGSLIIFSNDRQLIIDDNGVVNKNRRTDFTGTLVDIRLRCDESYYDLSSGACNNQGAWF